MSKLVEILARELEEWPEKCTYATQDPNREVRFDIVSADFYASELAEDCGEDFGGGFQVTREMWEAERAKFQVLEWNGEGLPPVGTVCESWYDDGRECWHKGVIVGAHPELKDYAAIAIKKGSQTDALIWSSQFRPTPTDREKWIEAAIESGASHRSAALIYDAGLAKLPD